MTGERQTMAQITIIIPNYNGTAYTANEKDGISIIQGSLKDLLNLYFGKNKDNEM